MYIEAPELASYPNIKHAFFTRVGGVSEGIYASLNGGLGSSDDPAQVAENRRRWRKTSTWPQARSSASIRCIRRTPSS